MQALPSPRSGARCRSRVPDRAGLNQALPTRSGIPPAVLALFLLLLVSGTNETRAIAQAFQEPQPPCTPSVSNDCMDPQNAGMSSQSAGDDAATVAGQSSSTGNRMTPPARNTSAIGDPAYVDRSGLRTVQQPNTRQRDESQIRPNPLTDFQRLAASSTGETLPIFGRDLFRNAPSTFAPGDQVAVSPEYVIGPGDQLLLRIWGPENFNGLLTVDRSGDIYVPGVGSVHVAGLQFSELETQVKSSIGRVFRNFDLSVDLGRLRSIQIYVVGEAQHPGAYTISSLSTVLNLLFACGGPNAQGSLRHIQVRRAGQPAGEFDLYNFILHGDKSKDIRLETGDTVFIPPVGPQVAVAGSVRHPAIYELAGPNTLGELLETAGGLSPTASNGQVSLERIREDRSRQAMAVALNPSGLQTNLRDGDVIFVNHISAAYEKTVSIRGNLANPGRFPWHPGMRLSDIIPDRMSLLTIGYWEQRNRLGLPVPLFSRSTQAKESTDSPETGKALNGETSDRETAPYRLDHASSTDAADSSGKPIAAAALDANLKDREGVTQKRNIIELPAPQIDWSYAVIERLDTQDLRNVLIPFNLGRLVKDHDESQDLELQPGDTITIFSQGDVRVGRDMQTKYIRLEGEFVASGVYSVGPNDTLADVVKRAGGLTSKAYLYGSNFTRESARALQQQRLDEYVALLSEDMERAAAERSVASLSGVTDPTALSEQRMLLEQLRKLRATGRVVLEFSPDSTGTAAIPRIPLEDGDVFEVPATPDTVSVVGAVYGPNVFLYSPSRRLEDYVALAGRPNRIADSKHAFIIRPDGSILSRERAQGALSNHFDTARIYPGDSIVIPEKLIKPPLIRSLVDYSQVLSSFGLAAAAVSVLR